VVDAAKLVVRKENVGRRVSLKSIDVRGCDRVRGEEKRAEIVEREV
jgi:hypothetical protein